MAKAVKMADIAKVMGVSTVTVSKALSDQKGVSEELRVKIKEKAEEMGYKTTSVRYRERQASAKSYTFGVIVSDRFLAKYESFYWNLYQEVATAAVGKGCFTMLEVLKAEDENQLVMPRLLGEKKAEGLIIIGSLRENYMDRLIEQLDLPFILLDFTDGNGVYDAVISNSYMGMYRMTNYLFDMGHRQIGFVGNVFFTGSITDRLSEVAGRARGRVKQGMGFAGQEWADRQIGRRVFVEASEKIAHGLCLQQRRGGGQPGRAFAAGGIPGTAGYFRGGI